MSDDALVVRPAARLRGTPALPGDKSISHRALLLALLAEGESPDHGRRRRRGRAVDRGDRGRARRHASSGWPSVDGRVDYRVVSPGGDALTEPDAGARLRQLRDDRPPARRAPRRARR